MFRELLTRLPDLHTTAPPDRLRSNFINGVKHLPGDLDAAAGVAPRGTTACCLAVSQAYRPSAIARLPASSPASPAYL